MQDDEFEWDDAKAASNHRKHGVTFDDPDHSDDEDRFLTIGMSAAGRVVIVSHTDRDGRIRIISAREASKAERQGYEDGTFP